jgi:hypothetical protein
VAIINEVIQKIKTDDPILEKKPTKKITKKNEEILEKKPTKKITKKNEEILEKKPTIKTTKKTNDVIESNKLATLEDIIIPDNYDYRENKKISKDITTIFDLGKITEISFINLRKYFIKYLYANNLIKGSSVTFDEKLKLLTFSKYEEIELKHIDKLIFKIIQQV